MNFIKNSKFDVKVHFILEGTEPKGISKDLAAYLKDLDYKGAYKAVFSQIGPGTANLVIVGLGKEEDLSLNRYRMAGFEAAKALEAAKVQEASYYLEDFGELDKEEAFGALIEGSLQQAYAFDDYKSEKSESHLETISLMTDVEVDKLVEETKNLVDGVNIARKLVNTPSMEIYPESLADYAVETLEDLGIKVTVYDKEQIKEMGMTAFLSVAQGSNRDPRFFVMEYLPEGADAEAIALVGKGLTYDSGGYAIKPANGMVTMKTDMAGSASVIGSLYALAKNKVEKNVIGIVAACENLISGKAYKNGDIVKSKKGTTIEIMNTDAEGRVTLADALYYAATEVNSESIIDIATLTGACIVALGQHTIGAVTNDHKLFADFKSAADYSGEYLWELPRNEELEEAIKGSEADLTNSVSKGGGGAITAGLFLEQFVEDKPWVHLDIAGPSHFTSSWSYYPKGATGIPVKSLYNYIKSQAK